jgi:hypothetical protein
MAVNNTLASVIPTLFHAGLPALRRNCVLPRLVMNDFGKEVQKQGSVIQVPLPSAISAVPVVPGAYAPDPGNLAPTTAPISLNQWYEAAFALSEQEIGNIIEGVIPMQLTAAVESLAAQINSSIWALYPNFWNAVGTPGTTPFASDLTACTKARTNLVKNLAPNTSRRMVLGPDAYGAALSLPSFYGALYNGGTAMIDEAVIGRKFGFDWGEDQQNPTDVLGTITGTLAGAAATAQGIGTTAVLCTTGSTSACALNAGNLIKFAGDAQIYSLTANAVQASAGAAVTLNISPGLQVAQTGGAAVTLSTIYGGNSGVINLAFHPWAMAFASRPLVNEELGEPSELEYMDTDPVSGITMRLSMRKEFRRTRFAFDVLWGVGPVRPQLACRVYG